MTLTTYQRCLLSSLALLLSSFFSMVSAHEQSSEHYTMTKDVLSNGGNKSNSPNYQMVATVGQYATRKSTANGKVLYSGFHHPTNIFLNPLVKLVAVISESPICKGEDFDVTFQVVTADSQPISNMGVYMEFDPKKMKINSINSSGKLDFTLTDRFSNEMGYIHFVAGSISNPPPTGTFNLVTVNFTALEESENTILHVDPTKSTAAFGGEQIPQEADDTTLVIEQCGPKECQVTLQRANPTPHPSWDQTELIISGDITDTIKTNDSGHCEFIKPLAEGKHSICVKNPRTLQNRIEPTIPLANGSEVIEFGTLLEGDFDDNNIIDMDSDFGYIITAILANVYDAKADLNVDNKVTEDDVSLFKNNYNLRPEGEVELHGETCTNTKRRIKSDRMLRDGKPSSGIVSLRTTPIPNNLVKGDTFDLPIQVTQQVEVAGAYLNFHPEYLKVNFMTPGNNLDFVLQSYFSNDRGIINYTAGLLEGERTEGSFTLVTINFTVLAKGGEKTLAFNMTPPRIAHAMYGGESVLVPGQEGSKIILEPVEVNKYKAIGTLKDKEDNPLAGVTIQIGEKTVVTDAAGHWPIDGLPEGEYTVIASKDGYRFDTTPCVVSNNVATCQPKIKGEPLLDVKVVPEPRIAKQGEDVTYRITVTNQGEGTATNVTLVDALPDKAELIKLAALDGGSCDAATLTCELPELTPGATANLELVVSNHLAETLVNTVTVTTQEYPTEVKKTWTSVKPYLSVTLVDQPDPVTMLNTLDYRLTVTLNQYAPSDATGVTVVSQLPQGVELKSIKSDDGVCDTSASPQITCQLNDLSIASADSISQATVEMEVQLTDGGLLLLTHQAKVTANEYPAHQIYEPTTIFIPEEIQVDLALVIDVTGSMQEEMNGVIKALKEFIAQIDSSQSPLMTLITFGDQVKVTAFTRDIEVLRGAIEALTASGGGLCEEAGVEALLVAIPHTKLEGDILFATDASPYPEADLEKVLDLLKDKAIHFNAFITGDCSMEESWNTLPQ
jgi:uncharacterized repeat protein (TIGR01451 family)